MTIFLFMCSGVSATFVGVSQAILYNSAQVSAGQSHIFNAIIAVVVGGVLLTGGYGSVLGIVLGTLTFAVVNQGIYYTGFDANWASLIIGVVWGLWHAPLFFIPGAPQALMPPLLFLAGTVGMSVAFARLAVNSGYSVLPAIVLHWSINAFAWAIPVTPQGGTLQPYVLVIGLLSLIAVIVFVKPGPKRPEPPASS
jgi:hypothetical protein